MSKYVQGSQEWLEWRKEMITASEVPAILGISPYTTAYNLWMQKKGLTVQKENSNMRYGSKNESIVRDKFIKKTGHGIEPGIAEHKTIKWLMASLDGITFNKDVICEIKCNRKEIHDNVKKGDIPEFHWMQVQIQMECADVDECHYVSDNAKDATYLTIITIDRNKKWFSDHIDVLKEFHESLSEDIPPKKR